MMFKDADGRISLWTELLGLAGIMASLIFVGLEIRQNTAVAKAEAYRELVSEINSIDMGSDHELLGRVWFGAKPEEFEPGELTAVMAYFMSTLRTYESFYKQYEAGVLEESDLRILSGRKWDNEFIHLAWTSVGDQFTPEFRAYFEKAHPYKAGSDPVRK